MLNMVSLCPPGHRMRYRRPCLTGCWETAEYTGRIRTDYGADSETSARRKSLLPPFCKGGMREGLSKLVNPALSLNFRFSHCVLCAFVVNSPLMATAR